MLRSPTAETLACLALAAGLAVTPIALFHTAPLAFAHLIAEDFAGEYATAAAFAAAGLLFLADARRTARRSRLLISLTIGIVALLIGGEEVSWGERQLRHLFGIDVSAAISDSNLQGEANLHNLEFMAPAVSSTGQVLGSGLMVAWLAASALVFWLRPEAADRWRAAGAPLVPVRLAPLCLLPALYFVLAPVAKSDEVGELLLGIAGLAFALDWIGGCGPSSGLRPAFRPVALPACLALLLLVALGLAAFSPLGRMSWRLHTLAVRDYPAYGLYEPAREIFAYIYAHPDQLMTRHTRLAHAEVLLAAGKPSGARREVERALAEVGEGTPAADGEFMRRAGRLYLDLGERALADPVLAAALAADQRRLAASEGPDERARLLLSLAQTLDVQGRHQQAAALATRAQDLAVSAGTRRAIRRWRGTGPG